MPTHQYSLALINHKVENSVIDQRAADGYINATAMCKAADRRIAKYLENDTTQAYLQELSSDVRIRISDLVQIVKGGEPHLQGTWVHPQVAIHLAQWLSPKFAVQVSKWVYEWMSGKGQPKAEPNLPYHLRRYMLNFGKVPPTHFSILHEMTNTLIAPLEAQGYTLPEKMMPDISQGKMFAKFAREKLGIDTNALPTYAHEFEDGRSVEAKLYPVQCLGAFREYIVNIWMPQRAAGYFRERDPSALPALDRMLRISYTPAANTPRLKTQKRA